MLSAIKFVLNM